MKKNRVSIKYKIILLLLVIISMFAMTPVGATYSIIENRNYSNKLYEENIELKNNVSLSGVYDGYGWNFNIDKTSKVTSIKAKVIFEVTDVLEKNIGSYLTFLVNGTEFYSKKITSNNGENQTIEVDLPIGLLKDGFNEFKIEGYLRITDMQCIDDLNTANWLVLKKESTIKLTQSNMIAENKISEFPYPLVNIGGYADTQIIIPDDYTDGELSAAFKFQMLMGREGGSADIIKAADIKATDIKNLSQSNLVYIGRKNSIPEALKKGVSVGGNISEQSYINVKNSPIGATGQEKILYVLSENDNELISAIKFLMNKDLTSQVNDEFIYINSKMDLDEKAKKTQQIFTFKELGYNPKVVEGLFRGETSINYLLPQNRKLGAMDTINLNFRYSENLDFDRSLFTVYINNIPVASKKLERDKAGGDNLQVIIPKDVLNTSYMEIKFTFDLLLNDVNCETREEKQPWAFIVDNSTIEINHKEIDQFYFNTYPAPFVSDWDMNEVLYVLPDNLSSSELTSLGNMLSYMGKDLKYNSGNINVISSGKLENQHKDKNIIVYGTPDNNKLIKDLNKYLWMPYNSDYTKFISNEKLTLMDEFSKRITTFQLDVSPYNNQKNMLILTSPKADLLEKSLVFFSEDKEFAKLNGDGAVIDEYGNARTFKYKEEIEKPNYERVTNLSGTSKILVSILAALAIFMMLSIFLYIRKNKVRIPKTNKNKIGTRSSRNKSRSSKSENKEKKKD